MADVATILGLIVLGILLIGAEITVIPGFGLVGIAGFGLTVWGCVHAWIEYGPMAGVGAIVTSGALAGFVVWIAMRARPARHLILDHALRGNSSNVPDLARLIGREGVARSTLRPGGIALIDGDPYDVVADDGVWVQPGTPVRVTRISTNSLVVEPIDRGNGGGSSEP
jgi:membrane-bound serine protease (ClpP class)